jgi:hypothetical protein
MDETKNLDRILKDLNFYIYTQGDYLLNNKLAVFLVFVNFITNNIVFILGIILSLIFFSRGAFQINKHFKYKNE